MEAARILSDYSTKYTLLFALWDLEEVGLIGSMDYARRARASADSIVGVIDIEMLGWDSNDDGLIDIHTNNIGQSLKEADTTTYVLNAYKLPLKYRIYNPGTYGSDHGSFWMYDYSAIVFSEAYYGGDFNTHYHSQEDKVEYITPKYFLNCAKLAMGVISTLVMAGPQ